MHQSKSLGVRFIKAFKRDRFLYLMFLLPLIYYILFEYLTLLGLVVAFKDIRVFRGFSSIINAKWNNFKYFKEYLTDPYFWKLVRNTLMLNLYELVFAFPAPILLALLLNEVKNKLFKRTIQTVTYLPHFISTVVICGLIVSFLSSEGMVNRLINMMGGETIMFLHRYEYFRAIYVISGIWQDVGWGTIIYLAALNGIDTEQYEAAIIDGANRLQQTAYITIPGILPTVSVLLIMQVGRMMNVGYQKIILLYNGLTYETADVISTYVYRRGLLEGNFAYSTAVGMFSTVIGCILITITNRICKQLKTTTLW